MGFSKMIALLQIKDKGHIIFVNAVNFYVARGRDALCLNEILGLKLSCMETEICKVGFSINSLEKYTKLIEKKDYSYIVYNYDNVFNRLDVLKRYDGKHKNEIKSDRNNFYALYKRRMFVNICFFVGKICSKIDFQFILNSKDISIVMFDIKLLNGSVIKVKGYNEIADYCYSNLNIDEVVMIEGYINEKYEINIDNILNV